MEDEEGMTPDRRHANWLFREGIRPRMFAEALYFDRMRGGLADTQEQFYDFQRSRPYLEHLKAQGFNQVWFSWWKGYGLQHERQRQDQVAALFPVCRELGLRPVCYHSIGSLTLDTLLLEEPGAEDWVARTQTGQPTSCQVTYQCFRCRPCFTADGYLAYMEKVLARAIDAGAEGIHFDNIGMQPEPESCHCARCTRLFREYLQARYGGDLGEQVFGMRDFRHATVPWFNQHNPANRFWRAMAPHHWSWIDFKCATYGAAARRLAEFVHRRNPQCFVEMNAAENDGFATAFWRANDHDAVYPHIELVCDEGNRNPHLNARGAMRGPYRDKKWCRAFGCAHWSGGDVLDFCDDLAMSSAPLPFWRRYKEYQLRASSTARIAVLRERHSLAYNRWDPWEETLAIEQYLIERRLPFDIVHNGQLGALGGRYDLLIVAGAEVMPDEVRDAIVAYVRGGGSLLLTGAAGVYDRYYRRRCRHLAAIRTVAEMERARDPRNAFHELIGADPDGSGEATVQREVGKGRAAWVRAMDVDRLPRTAENWIITDDWFALPRNAPEIDRLLGWLVPAGFGVAVASDAKLYVHTSVREDTGERLVHLIHHEHPPKLAAAEVRLRVPSAPTSVVSISVDDADTEFPERPEDFHMDGQVLCVRLEAIRRHRTMIVRGVK
jgi:hypothetical protein